MTLHDRRPAQLDDARGRSARLLALVVGAVFVVVGILGFIPGITTDHDQLRFAGHESQAQLLGVFQVSVLHNLLHLGLGVAGLAAARRNSWSVAYLFLGGVAYLGLWVWGMAVSADSEANLVPLDSADNWLHLGLGVGMLALGTLGQWLTRGTVAGDIGQ